MKREVETGKTFGVRKRVSNILSISAYVSFRTEKVIYRETAGHSNTHTCSDQFMRDKFVESIDIYHYANNRIVSNLDTKPVILTRRS